MAELKYPFEFKELLLTDKVLDVLGFSEYWAGSGDFGTRCFGEKISEGQYKRWYRILEIDESEDPDAGYGGTPEYCASHFMTDHFYKNAKTRYIYFLHDLYEDIKDNAPEVLDLFIEKTKEEGVNMYPYIKSWIEFNQNK